MREVHSFQTIASISEDHTNELIHFGLRPIQEEGIRMLNVMNPRVRCSVYSLLISGLILKAAVGIEPRSVMAPKMVSVEIFERLPEKWDEVSPNRPADEVYKSPLMGFAGIPKKYNSKGAIIDRAAPFLMVSKFERAYPKGDYDLILRSRAKSTLRIDGKKISETKSITNNAGGHEEFPPLVIPSDKRLKALETNSQERLIRWTSDGNPHEFELSSVIGDKKTRPETGELAVYLIPRSKDAGAVMPVLAGPVGAPVVDMTDSGWNRFRVDQENQLAVYQSKKRHEAYLSEDAYWQNRHALARKMVGESLKDLGELTPGKLDRLIQASVPSRKLAPLVDDSRFLRRVYLDVVGQVPTPEEQLGFMNDPDPNRRQKLIDQLLNDSRRADAWMGYWQDLLAENPGILKPTLNNTGPFRYFLREVIGDNLPMDRMVTQLVRMEGSVLGGSAAGFSMASQNDSPMAAKAHIIAKAFLASELKCARCHDAPKHPYDQSDLFELAAMLAGKPLAVPKSSSVVVAPGARVPAISISLEPGDSIAPRWSLSEISSEDIPTQILPANSNSRDRMAALLTWAGNRRFAKVIVNRVWAVRTGRAFVDPIDDWDVKTQVRFPEALEALAVDFMRNGYDLKRLDRMILNSQYYQASVVPVDSHNSLLGPARRRISAEQLVDSLFAVSGKSFECEELCLDPEGRRPASEFISLGHPRHAWEMISPSNERDRPALGLPAATQITDLMQAFGWRSSRQDPLTIREEAVTPLQPGILATGLVHTRIARLSDQSKFTEIALSANSVEELADLTIRRVLSRPATAQEINEAKELFSDEFTGRIQDQSKPILLHPRSHRHRVSWSNHLRPLATEIQIEEEALVRAGDAPTCRLTNNFREAYEDWVWALLNSPEFLFLP